MKTLKLPLLFLASAAFCFPAAHPVRADNVYSANVVGYVNIYFVPGNNVFGNPLDQGTNTLSTLFPAVPDGSTVSLWNSLTQQYFPVSTYHLGWDINYQLDVGGGAIFNTPTGFTNTFIGGVLQGPGTNEINPPIPPVRPPGYYLLSSLFPATDRTFQDMIGRDPVEGEFVKRFDPITQTYSITTFHNGSWDNGVPTLGIAEGAFFNLGPVPVPEPATFSLIALGFGLAVVRRRMKN